MAAISTFDDTTRALARTTPSPQQLAIDRAREARDRTVVKERTERVEAAREARTEAIVARERRLAPPPVGSAESVQRLLDKLA